MNKPLVVITPTASIFTFPGRDKSQLTFRMCDDCGHRSDIPIAYIVS
jgi:hypothetical protein